MKQLKLWGMLAVVLAWAIAAPVQAQTPDLTGNGRPIDRGDAASKARLIDSNLP
ncbi:hypothetical protein IQ249_04440 [Lusitaniella coriacea LEGE 07157]|uniref:Uncharacterized protein n=1 Tax=Lusitaniella coriacea LEGE 07157 TaxID=945747 RepID=A0A8J7B3K9_9CYAN|nr:hypothetical protein [Lusitaniella coriacea]MBE9115142.1 hypothetical protein [Lusitaniella coriacea LEGE 07157]